ncbi:acyltransferase family protein [Brevibacillus parabrevis]|uniref:acyltransferase family protein n=1 Tax=Brevibacillus parabrevis TaxID=54914 RepID=UPI002E2256A2|nr:acyltransferase family protein [Brevibacillus parabrevis]MED1724405.1 acyltransferase family protein [Brevibacillus parabrevis]
MPEPIKAAHSRYMPGIDGLRALAVLAVIIYHLNYNWAPGGLLGVGIFFVLSGYLITDLLIAQWSRNGRLDMKDFWLRRARRLLPALLLLLVAVVASVALFSPEQMGRLRGDVWAALFYVSNWWLVFSEVSYFEKFGPPSPLGHLWSLAVEEQFYLIWPLLVALGLSLIKRRGPLVILTLGLAAVSAVLMAVMYEPGEDPSRIYYGTDTRVFALLIGAALAMMWPSRKLSTTISGKARATLDVIGCVSLAILLWAIWKTNQYDDFLYQGGLVLLSIVSAILVAVLAHPASSLAKWMGCKPLKWLGVRSYGIYLWHYPVIVLTSPTAAAEESGAFAVLRACLQVLACIVLAALSWKYMEEPIRHGALGKLWAKLGTSKQQGAPKRSKKILASGCAFALAVLYFGVASLTSGATAGDTSAMQKLAEASAAAENSGQKDHLQEQNVDAKSHGPQVPVTPKKPEPTQKPSTQTATKPKTESKPNAGKPAQGGTAPAKNQDNSAASKQPKASEEPDVAAASGKGITAIGDSVMLDIEPYLAKLLPGIVIDGKVGRQMAQAPDVIKALRAKGQLGSRVIIELGTNGSFSKGQLDKLLKALDGVDQVILINTRVPRPWESVVNETLAEVAAAHPNMTLIDWHSASAGKNTYFYKDGVHLNSEGARAYALLVAKTFAPVKAEKPANEATPAPAPKPEESKKPASDENKQETAAPKEAQDTQE